MAAKLNFYIFRILLILIFASSGNASAQIGDYLRSLADKIDGATKQLNSSSGRAVSLAKDAVTSTLRDPDSVKFRDIREAKSGAVCGYYNGKNAYGGYAGYSPFLYFSKDTRVEKSDNIGFLIWNASLKFETTANISYILVYKNQLFTPDEEDALYRRICT